MDQLLMWVVVMEEMFFILNVAMGGHWFDVDPQFNESTMEVDYIRIYQ